MNRVSKLSLGLLWRVGVLVVAAKFVATVLYLFLPTEGVEVRKSYSFTPPYVRIDLARVMGFGALGVHTAQSGTHAQTHADITDLILKGLYGNAKKGYAIVAKRSTPKKTAIIGIGESYAGYRLKSIELHDAVFVKGGREYRLVLQASKIPADSKIHLQSVQQGALHRVKRSEVGYFAKNPREIWRNISISEIRKNGKITGFRVTWVRPGSRFATLGLQKGDIIIKANNKRLRSYKDAVDIYANIGKLKEISIVVVRNGEEKELVYEID